MKKQIKKPKETPPLSPLSAAECQLYAAAIAAARKTNAALLLNLAARETLLDYMERQIANHTFNGTCVETDRMKDKSFAKCWAQEQAAWYAAENPSKK